MLALLTVAVLTQPLHFTRSVEGWRVEVDRRLFSSEHRATGARALRCLSDQLFQIKDRVPASKLKKLQKVTIWLDLDNKDLEGPQYHPSADWLRDNGFDTAMKQSVHIPKASYFAAAGFQFAQPFAVLHEMAHAYHDRVLGFGDDSIRAAWTKFAADPKQANVLRYSGRLEKHYGVTNPMEYFAEMTESYFGTNDFYPFVRAELQRDEPDSYKLMQVIWGAG